MRTLVSPRARAAILSALLLSSCGSGTAGYLSSLGGGDDGDSTPGAVVLGDLVVAGGSGRAAEPPATISLRLTDSASRSVAVELLVVPPAGAPFAPLLDQGTLALASSPSGTTHELAWDFAAQLPSGAAYSAGYRVSARIVGSPNVVESAAFAVGNDAPSVASVVVPTTTASGTIQLDVRIQDSADDPVALTVEYQDADLDSAWVPASIAGSGLAQLASSASGVTTALFWSSAADLPESTMNVRFRVRPSDAWSPGAPTVSDAFAVDNNGVPVVGVPAVVGSTRTPPVSFELTLHDPELDPADVEVLYVPPSGPAVPAVLAPGSTTSALPTDGSPIALQWDYAAQLASGSGYATGVRLRVRALDGGAFQDTAPFAVGNDAAWIAATSAPATPTAGIVPVELDVEDSSRDVVSIAVEYAIVEDGGAWIPASLVGAPPTHVATDPDGVAVTVFWDAPSDVPGRTCTARLRFTADDGTIVSAPVATDPFVVDGNARPVVLLNGSAFFATPDDRRGIPLPFRVHDAEGDDVLVVFQWRGTSDDFVALPESRADVLEILADDGLRRAHRVASAMPIAETGRARAASPTSVVLPDLAVRPSALLGEPLVGQTLEILRAPGAPAAVAPAWSTNPLVAPAGAVACPDARSAWVLDAPAAGSWRVQRVDLATGAVLAHVATGSDGDPDAIAAGWTSGRLLVASDASGAWRVHDVEVATGAVTTIAALGGAAPAGAVRGLVATADSSALMTVGSALVAVDAASPAPAVVLAGLASPRGLALDPRHDGRVLLAERDAIDASTPLVTGRVVSVDLATLERRVVAPNGPSLARPDAIAVEPGTARLWVVTDASAVDGTRELRQVLLAGGGGGVAAEIASALPDGTRGLAVGADGLVVLALPGADLAVAGGVEQARTITGFDAATCAVDCDEALAPFAAGSRRWRIAPDVRRAARRPTHEQRFVWLSSAVPEPDGVVLRATPYDARRGLAADTGVPRAVATSLDVAPTTIGGGAATSVATGVVAADLDGDGDVDLAVTSQGNDSVAIFLQSSAGAFPSAPNQSVAGIPILAPMTNPVAVRAVDVDGDGDLDLVTANEGSHNFSVLLQTLPGVFATQLLSLGLGASAPVDVATGDFNGDGRTDLVTANGGGDNLTVFFQLVAGLYLPLPSLVLGSAATTDSPSAVASGDFDLDGDLDIACAASNRVAVFLQTATGVFPPAPSFTIGGAGTTPDPSSLALGDVDGDGRLDVAVASRASSSVAIFLQSAPGTFAATPDQVLASAVGPFAPRHVELTDVGGDGLLDVLTVDADDELTLFLRDPAIGAFAPRGIAIEGAGLLSGPARLASGDFDGDGAVDVAVTSSTSGDVALFLQRGGGAYSAAAPDLVRGNAVDTPGASAVATGDLDGDGDLDLAVAAPSGDRIVTYEQWSPGTFAATPHQTLGSTAATDGVAFVCAADLDGDGRVDLVGANAAAGTLALFRQSAGGAFATAPDATLGAGALLGVCHVAAADLDGDGRPDLVCANPTSNDVAVFLQGSDGAFPAAPSFRRGAAGTTSGACHVVAADVDLDGDLDLVSANRTQDTLTVWAQTAPGVFVAAPVVVGSAQSTDGPRQVVAADLDQDGDVDLACANSAGNTLAVFARATNGAYPAVPSAVLSHASLSGPSTLAAADVDLDGLPDLVCGAAGSQRVLAFRQLVRGRWSSSPQPVGSAAHTPSPGWCTVVDLDGDGDLDVVSPQSSSSVVAVYFGSH